MRSETIIQRFNKLKQIHFISSRATYQLNQCFLPGAPRNVGIKHGSVEGSRNIFIKTYIDFRITRIVKMFRIIH
jgi:hypothetical protein